MQAPIFSRFVLISLGVIILVALAQYQIDTPESFGKIPITGQSLAVLIVAYLLGLVDGSLAILIYLLLGLLGLPVFADGASGLAVFLGPSGGFLYGFLIAAILSNLIFRQKTYDLQSIGSFMVLCTTVILVVGGLHLLLFISPAEVWSKGIEPFLPGAMIKLIFATLCCYGLRKYILKTNNS